MNSNLIITAQQRDALLAYLMERPFKEVASAVMWLQQLPAASAQSFAGAPDGATQIRSPGKTE